MLDQRFRLDALLGSGAMGAVYGATAADGHGYAIKLLLDDAYARNQELIGRFVREGRLTAQLDAPNLAKVFELGVDAPTSTPFIVMELLDGFDVDGLVGKVGAVHPRTAARIVSQAARGLAVAHAAGIVHRDIKPANLFLHRPARPSGGAERSVVVKVCDFGIAKAIEAAGGYEGMTATGTLLGSPLYMSPEQIKSSKHVDARSDVWSLGMAMWTLLAGRPSMAGVTSLSDLMISLTTKPVPWIQDVAPWVDPALARALHGTLLRDLGARCPSLEALIEALVPFTEGGDALTEAELVGAPAELRASAAPRTSAGASWSESVPQRASSAPATDPSVEALVGQTLAGRYRLDRVLGMGGMGAVFQGTSLNGAQVAIKVILGDVEKQRPEILKRFVREARATMAIESPNVVKIVDVDSDPQRGFPFIVMELLSGSDLDRLVKQQGALEPEPAVRVFLQACVGLTAAHARAVVHRDIKPANLFLHVDQAGAVQVKVCDFGIAKQVATDDGAATELTRTGGMLGSPMYMSPEQARSAKHVDRETDVWSLGVALYEALSGHRPWEKYTTVGELIIAICTESVPPIQDWAPWIDPALACVVHRALERDPKARFSSMEAFGEALRPFSGGTMSVTAAALTPVSRERRSVIAPRAAFAATTAGVAATGADAAPARPRKRSALTVAALAVFVTIAAGFGVVAVSKRGGDANASAPSTAPLPAAAPPSGDPAASAEPARFHVRIKVAPATAEVSVDGKPRALDAGALALEGEPGERFEVVAKVGERSKRETVLIGKDGKPSIDAIDVPEKPPKGAPPSAAGTARPTGSATSVATASVPPAVMTATASPTAVAPPPPPTATAAGPVGANTF